MKCLQAFVANTVSRVYLTYREPLVVFLTGGVMRIRTGINKGSMAVPCLAQRPRHSARAVARLVLKNVDRIARRPVMWVRSS